jgi:putative hydrolase of the HAD superfamily
MGGRPEALILDFGGVLTRDFWGALANWCEREGLRRDALTSVLRTDERARALLEGLERGSVRQDEFAAYLAGALGLASAGILQRMAAELKPDEAMIAAAAAVRAAGIPVGILSNSWGSQPLDPYAAWHLDDNYDVVVISDRVGVRKPERRIYEIAVEQIGVPAELCVFVDDVAAYLEPARKLGMTVIHQTDTAATIAAIESLFGLAFQPA